MNLGSFNKLSIALIGLLFILLTSCISCRHAQEIPKSKEAFIGIWHSPGGFEMEIKASGLANLTEIANPLDSEATKLNVGVTPKYAKEMLVDFDGDSLLTVSKQFVRAKQYKINKSPYMDGETGKMVLNGVILTKQ